MLFRGKLVKWLQKYYNFSINVRKVVKLGKCNRALTSAPSFFLCDIVREGGLDETVPRIEHWANSHQQSRVGWSLISCFDNIRRRHHRRSGIQSGRDRVAICQTRAEEGSDRKRSKCQSEILRSLELRSVHLLKVNFIFWYFSRGSYCKDCLIQIRLPYHRNRSMKHIFFRESPTVCPN